MGECAPALIGEVLAFKHRLFPVEASLLGFAEHDQRLGDYEPEAMRQSTAELARLDRAIEECERDGLTREQRGDLAMLAAWVERTRLDFAEVRMLEVQPHFYVESIYDGLDAVLRRPFGSGEEQATVLCGRLREVGPFLKAASQNVRRPPRLFTELALETIEAGVPFLKQVSRTPVESEAQARCLQKLCHAAYHHLIDYHSFLQAVAASQPERPFAVGPEIYDRLLGGVFRIDMEPAEVAEWGRTTLERARLRMTEIAARLEPGRPWRTVLARIQAEVLPDDGLLEAYRSEVDRAREFVLARRLVRLPVEVPLRIVETPVFERGLVPVAAYEGPPPYGPPGPATLYVSPREEEHPLLPPQPGGPLPGHSRSALPLVVAGQVFPGNHTRVSHPPRTDSPVRREMLSSLLCNGWSMYAELLMGEAGYYDSAEVDLQLVRHVMWRAVRLIIDVGMHAGGMSTGEAARLLTEESGLPAGGAFREVRRIAVSPGMQLSYLLGRQQILDLRRRAERAWGGGFALDEFHARLLACGPVPPAVAAEEMFEE